eukprot:1161585-Pelagomonas_calceolata.AAC.13
MTQHQDWAWVAASNTPDPHLTTCSCLDEGMHGALAKVFLQPWKPPLSIIAIAAIDERAIDHQSSIQSWRCFPKWHTRENFLTSAPI